MIFYLPAFAVSFRVFERGLYFAIGLASSVFGIFGIFYEGAVLFIAVGVLAMIF